MALQEYDPSLSPSEYNVGESYIFIRNISPLYDKNSDLDGDKTVSTKGVKEVKGAGVKEVKDTKGTGVKEVKTGVKLVEDESETKAASSTSGNIVEKDYESGKSTVVESGRWYKQVGKIVAKEPRDDGSVYLHVQFDGVNGVRKYKCPVDPSMYYIIDRQMDSCGTTKAL